MIDHRGEGPSPGTLWWEQQDWESDTDYLKFMAYRDMGASRRLHLAAATYYGRTAVGPPSDRESGKRGTSRTGPTGAMPEFPHVRE